MKYLLIIVLFVSGASCVSQKKIVTVKRTYFKDGTILVSEPSRIYMIKPSGDTTIICTYECENCDDLFESQ